jgi:hypothetical protein
VRHTPHIRHETGVQAPNILEKGERHTPTHMHLTQHEQHAHATPGIHPLQPHTQVHTDRARKKRAHTHATHETATSSTHTTNQPLMQSATHIHTCGEDKTNTSPKADKNDRHEGREGTHTHTQPNTNKDNHLAKGRSLSQVTSESGNRGAQQDTKWGKQIEDRPI